MLRRNLLSVLPFLSALKLQGKQEEKPFRTVTNEFSDGFWVKSTYDQNGNLLTCENSLGNWNKYTYNQNGKVQF